METKPRLISILKALFSPSIAIAFLWGIVFYEAFHPQLKWDFPVWFCLALLFAAGLFAPCIVLSSVISLGYESIYGKDTKKKAMLLIRIIAWLLALGLLWPGFHYAPWKMIWLENSY